MDIILASRNMHKTAEIKDIFRDFPITLFTLDRYPEIGEIEETGKTLEENALLKARTVHEKTGLSAIGDDTGLEVDALNGEPGVFSARYAGENASYEDNVNKLLTMIAGVPDKQRTARFRTVTAFVDGKHEILAEGLVEGKISTTPKGTKGFGYDSVFVFPKLNRTFAELSAKEKNRISHRGQSLQKLYKQLTVYWGATPTIGD